MMMETLRVGNLDGVHLRVATDLARVVTELDVALRIARDGRDANAGSPIEVLALGVTAGTCITVTVEGDQAEAAIARVRELVGAVRGAPSAAADGGRSNTP